MIKVIHDKIVFKSFNDKLIEIPAQVLIDFLDCDKLDAILVREFANSTDMHQWSVLNPLLWQLIVGWSEILNPSDFAEWFCDEIEAEARVSTLWPKECA